MLSFFFLLLSILYKMLDYQWYNILLLMCCLSILFSLQGWEEGVVGMKKNGRRLLIVPPPLAYGKKGLGSRIPPNSTLLFDVEIKKVIMTI